MANKNSPISFDVMLSFLDDPYTARFFFFKVTKIDNSNYPGGKLVLFKRIMLFLLLLLFFERVISSDARNPMGSSPTLYNPNCPKTGTPLLLATWSTVTSLSNNDQPHTSCHLSSIQGLILLDPNHSLYRWHMILCIPLDVSNENPKRKDNASK